LHVVIVIYPDCQLLDVAGPASVFAEAAIGVSPAPYRVVLASRAGGPVAAEGGVTLGSVALADLSGQAVDTLLVAGGSESGLRAMLADPELGDRVMALANRARRYGSVCSGAFALAHWGLLDGRRAATHWQASEALARRFPMVAVDHDALFVEDGPVWTSAGVSTGIDMALALVERDLGRVVAASVARRLVLQMRRPGHQSQFSAVLAVQAGAYDELVAWIGDHLTEALPLERLAAQAGQAPRTFHRRFLAETGATPAAFVARLRLDRARVLLEAGQTPKRVARLTGFGSLDRLGRAFRRAYGLSPSGYRAVHGGPAGNWHEAACD
jgi:transcriptional regulator GlxA family with amidase domain